MTAIEIGLFTLGEITADPTAGRPLDPAVRLRDFIALAKIAHERPRTNRSCPFIVGPSLP